MANPKGIITRKDIVDDEAMRWGEVYAENIKEAVKQNNILVDSVKILNKQVQAFKVANSQKDYITAKQAEALATQQAIDAIKKQEAAEISADKVKRSSIATMEAERKAKQSVIDAENKAQKSKEASVKLTIEERVQNEINNKALKQEALERLGLVSAYTKLNAARTESKNKLRDLIASESASTAEIKKAQKEFENLDGKVRKADQAVGDFTKNVGNYPFKNITSGLKNLIGAFGVTGGIAAFSGIMKGAYETTKKFEQGLADLSAITGASGKDLSFLKNSALEMGKGVKGGAIAVVEAYKLIGSAKPELLNNIKALNSVTEATVLLSKAAGIELPDAATALTDAMNQFGVDASQASEFVNTLANGAKFGAAEIPQVTEALLKFGAVARSSNINIKESTALIELLAENGIKGVDAGTALRNVLLKISAPDALPKEAQKAMKDLGISFELLKDKSIPIQEKFEALKPLLADNGKLLKSFGFENVVAARNIIEHTDRLNELTLKMGTFGTAQEQADVRMNTLNGKTEILSSTYDSLVLSIGNGSGAISDFFKFFIEGATSALNGLIRLNTSWDDLFKKASEDGSKDGKRLFDERFNSLIGENLSDTQRKKIRERIKIIQDEISKGINVKNNKTEEKDLLRMFGSGTDEEVSLSIARAAEQQGKIVEKKLSEIRNKLRKYAENEKQKGSSGQGFFGKTKQELKKEEEDLIKELSTQNAIIEENNKKRRASRVKVEPEQTSQPLASGESDADRKKREATDKKALVDRLAREKALADSLYELQKQRLEQNIQFNDEITKDDAQADEVRVQTLLINQQKQFDLLLLTKKYLLDSEKLTADDRIRIEEDYTAKKVEISKKTALEIDKINEFDFSKYQSDIDNKIKAEQTKANNLEVIENTSFKKILDNKTLSQKQIEEATKSHEEQLFQIKKDSAIAIAKLQADNLELELNAFKAQSDGSTKSNALITDLELKLSEARKKLGEIELEEFKKKETDKTKTVLEQSQEINKISQDLLGGLSSLSSAFSQAKIQALDDELKKNNEFYDKQIELAGKDQRQKDLLTKERDKKNAELDKKKRAEQTKQANLDKTITIAKIALQTALAIITAAAATAPTFWGVAIASTLGAISLATAIATPIPKYKDGRVGGKKEIAMINDGGVTEVVEKKDGSAKIYSGKNRIVQLFEGDTVHKSMEDYQRMQRVSMMTSIDIQGRKLNDFQSRQILDANNDRLLDEIKLTRKAIEKNKNNIHFHAPKIDIGHVLWGSKNKYWN
jgi:TP901 family phage tail tape measure protein